MSSGWKRIQTETIIVRASSIPGSTLLFLHRSSQNAAVVSDRTVVSVSQAQQIGDNLGMAVLTSWGLRGILPDFAFSWKGNAGRAGGSMPSALWSAVWPIFYPRDGSGIFIIARMDLKPHSMYWRPA
jgi:hypothetical protein